MGRFTELLLLVACTHPLLFVNGFQALQPSVKNNPLRTDAVNRGLLAPRQFFCQTGFNACDSNFCCPTNWDCCGNGSCCPPSFFCDNGSNGVIGCCPNGETCSGPVGEPTTLDNLPPPPSKTTKKPSPPPKTTKKPQPPPRTTTITRTKTVTHSASTTHTTLSGGPTQSAGNQIIDVSVLDVNTQWSGGWVLQKSSCDPSIRSKITSTENSSFTYLSNHSVTSSNYFYYINVANANTEWEVFVNGVSQNTYFSNSSGFTNCTYLQSSHLISVQVDVSQNITVVVLGLESKTLDRSTTSDPWSLEVNMLLIQELNSSSANSTTPTPTSAAGRAQPYRPLLVPGSILLAAVVSILRL